MVAEAKTQQKIKTLIRLVSEKVRFADTKLCLSHPHHQLAE